MKIGIMLRLMGQHEGGVLVSMRGLLQEMLALDSPHEFVLLYNDPQFVGTFGDGDRIRELAIKAPHIFIWDQVVVRWLERREKLDLIFNPKFSIPLMAECPTVWECRGLDPYVMSWGSRWMDRLNYRYLYPRYAKKATAIIAVSNTARRHLIEYLEVDEERVQTVYHGVDEAFRKAVPREKLEKTKRAYGLPQRFFLYCGQIYPPKNFGRLIQAYARVGPELGISLVVAGQHTWLCEKELALIDELDLSRWVLQPGWIDRDTLPSFYALAEALVMPSLYEACPNPILEAMASGCPIVTANRYGTAELADQAAVLVDPEDIESIADGILRIISDHDLRRQMVKAGRERASGFSWKKCAQETFQVLENVLAKA